MTTIASSSSSSSTSSSSSSFDLVVVAPTFYPNIDDLRYKLGIEACQEAAKHEIRLILIDASPLENVKKGLEEAGKPFVQVIPQTWDGKKGVALREAIHVAYHNHSHNHNNQNQEIMNDNKDHNDNENHDKIDDKEEENKVSDEPQIKKAKTETTTTTTTTTTKTTVIAFMELEKVDMFRHWKPLVQHMERTNSDVTVPRRSDATFKKCYPIEQYFSENFVNLYLDCLGKEIGLTSIDWTMGPVAFRSTFAEHWLQYKTGDLWDVQLVPLVNAHAAGAKVSSFQVDYHHPVTMKEQEEGSAIWGEKRLFQINVLKDTVGERMKEIAAERKEKS